MSEPSIWTWVLYNVFCFPLKLYIDHQMKKPSHRAYAHQSNTPSTVPLPLPARSRQLSIADVSKNENDKKTAEQLHSPFFRLPQEIRLHIYEHAVGQRLLHLRLGYKGSKHKKVLHPRCFTCKYGEKHTAHSHWTNCSTRHDHPTPSLTPLLRSCRRVYTEAIHILYTTNVFDFKDWYCLQLFLPRILPQRLESLRSVRFYYVMHHYQHYCLEEYYEAYYEAPWEALLSMPGLRELRVKLSTPGFPQTTEFWTANDGRWLAPLKRFENLQVFEVYLPLPRTERLPIGLNVGSCQLYAVDEHGTPYRDFDIDI